jgi:hypothetical protein
MSYSVIELRDANDFSNAMQAVIVSFAVTVSQLTSYCLLSVG